MHRPAIERQHQNFRINSAGRPEKGGKMGKKHNHAGLGIPVEGGSATATVIIFAVNYPDGISAVEIPAGLKSADEL
jgi:hypothetical protein